MSPTSPLARIGTSPHLVDLLAEIDDLAPRVRAAGDEQCARLAQDRSDAAALATLRLDGSPLESLPSLEHVTGQAPPTSTPRRGTWLDAMRALDDEPDERLQAMEVLGVRAGFGSDDLARALRAGEQDALEELHRRLTHGLVADERVGRRREVEQAVHDASTGRILYFTTDPARIDDELAGLSAWLAAEAQQVHAVLASGMLHLEVLRIHPFDAANGRLARAAARLVLRAGGLDPDGLACPEPELARDPLGYYTEVASTARRRDATIWLERWAEAVAAGLRTSAAELGRLPTHVPEAGARSLAALDGAVFTVADYREASGQPAQAAQQELRELLAADRIARVPGSRGLRFVIT